MFNQDLPKLSLFQAGQKAFFYTQKVTLISIELYTYNETDLPVLSTLKIENQSFQETTKLTIDSINRMKN